MKPQGTDICKTLHAKMMQVKVVIQNPAAGAESSGQGPSSNNNTPGSPFYATEDSGAGTSETASQGVANPVEVTSGTEGGATDSAEAAVDSTAEENGDTDPATEEESSGQGPSSNNNTPGSPFYVGDSGAGTSGAASQQGSEVAPIEEIPGTTEGGNGSFENYLGGQGPF